MARLMLCIVELNIKHYRELLTSETDASKRRTIAALLADIALLLPKDIPCGTGNGPEPPAAWRQPGRQLQRTRPSGFLTSTSRIHSASGWQQPKRASPKKFR